VADTASTSLNREIGEGQTWFKVIGRDRLDGMKSLSSTIAKTTDLPLANKTFANREFAAESKNFVVGFPLALLGQTFVFGSVITKVSDRNDPGLGGIKLASLTPIQVTTALVRGTEDGSFFLELSGCTRLCSPDSSQQQILSIPVVGLDANEEFAMLDLEVLGKNLDLFTILNQGSAADNLSPIGSELTEVDFTQNTLVFDIDSKYGINGTDESVTLTARWYLRAAASYAADSFSSRNIDQRVGFFTTSRRSEPRITRFASGGESGPNVKYYVKNVPQEFEAPFAGGFDDWNEEFSALIGAPLIDYEFIPAGDPRNELIIAGDIRYNVLEWDVDNKASYGGLGPSIADQITGQVISATTLVQGPTIVGLYREWFNTAAKQGQSLATELDLRSKLNNVTKEQYALSLGDLDFEVPGQNPDLEDPIARRLDFYDTPAGFTFDSYMDGYFREIVAHELGHNLGLRHNFKGNLGASRNDEPGKVSRSVMEYLGRTVRHLNRVSEYDTMAIAFGYKGEMPFANDWFCTDEDVASLQNTSLSPECSRDDLGNDPLTGFKNQLIRATDLSIGRGNNLKPNWDFTELSSEVVTATSGIGFYYKAAETAEAWTNWNRDRRASEVRKLITDLFVEIVCDPTISKVIDSKVTDEAREKSAKNFSDLQNQLSQTLTSFQIPIPFGKCNSSL
jgi:hypothetical protein